MVYRLLDLMPDLHSFLLSEMRHIIKGLSVFSSEVEADSPPQMITRSENTNSYWKMSLTSIQSDSVCSNKTPLTYLNQRDHIKGPEITSKQFQYSYSSCPVMVSLYSPTIISSPETPESQMMRMIMIQVNLVPENPLWLVRLFCGIPIVLKLKIFPRNGNVLIHVCVIKRQGLGLRDLLGFEIRIWLRIYKMYSLCVCVCHLRTSSKQYQQIVTSLFLAVVSGGLKSEPFVPCQKNRLHFHTVFCFIWNFIGKFIMSWRVVTC